MGDAVCGPSNPLQQFKQQTALDRSLQQDRLASRATPSQTFRSQNRNLPSADREFEAFQAGLGPNELAQFPQLPHQQVPGFAGSPADSLWAADFNRLNIAGPSSSQYQHRALSSSPATTGWAQDFRAHNPQLTQLTPARQHSPLMFQRAQFGMGGGFQSAFAPPEHVESVNARGKQPVVEAFDDAAFERAFEQAKNDIVQDTQEPEHMTETVTMTDAQDETVLDRPVLSTHEKVEHLYEEKVEPLDAHMEPQVEEPVEQVQEGQDDDALALTAQELLEKVEHNQSDKFKNSQFLGLMRKLRDREVKVQGDKMVETVSHPHKLPHTPSFDSAYASGPVSPSSMDSSPPADPLPEVAPAKPWYELESTEFDHWESPVR